MKFQYLRIATLGAAVLASACATTATAPQSRSHAEAPAIPTSLSRFEIAQNYTIKSVTTPAAAPTAKADPSFALAHEAPGLRNPADATRRHAGAPHSIMKFLTGAEAPDGWVFDKDQAVRHVKSGLICPASIEVPDENRRFLLRDIDAFDAKGLDVGCNYSTDTGAFLTLYASYWPEMSLEDSLAGAVAAIKQRFSVKSNLSVSVVTLKSHGDSALFAGLESPRAAAFDIGEMSRVSYKTAVWLVKTYGWHVKARATYPQQDQTSEIVSAVMFALSHLNVRAKNMEEPVTPGSEV